MLLIEKQRRDEEQR
jgi:hypothetical protein